MSSSPARLIAFAAALFLAAGVPARSQTLKSLVESLLPPENTASSGKKDSPGAAEQILWVEDQIKAAQEKLAEVESEAFQKQLADAGFQDARAAEFADFARQILRNYQISRDVLQIVVRSEAAVAALPGVPATPPPKTETEAGLLREKLAEIAARLESARAEDRLADSRLAQVRTAYASADQQYWRAVDDDRNAPEGEAKSRAQLNLSLAELARHAASSAVYFRAWRKYADELDIRLIEAEQKRAAAAMKESGFDNALDRERVDQRLARLAESRRATLAEKQAAEAKVAELRANLQKLESDLAAQKAAGRNAQSLALLQTRVDLARDVFLIAERTLASLEARLIAFDDEQRIWQSVRAFLDSSDPDQLRQLREQTQASLEIIRQARTLIEHHLQDERNHLDELEEAPAASSARDTQAQALRQTGIQLANQRINLLKEFMKEANYLIDVEMSTITEIDAKLAVESLAARAAHSFESFGTSVSNVWNYQLVRSQNLTISVGKVVLGIVGLTLALFLSKFLALQAARASRSRFQVGEGHGAFVEKLVFYFLAVIFVLTILNWLSIPLTVFAFAGGALAIGIGFGTQTLMNNFISGLILLVERRIRVGDLIEVDGHFGRITGLGSRFSMVRKLDGVEVLVPNSSLLEKNVVNWTLSDPHHRYNFTLGVGYGSDPQQVLQILQKAMDEQSEILRDPAPLVFFDDFGDSALVFHLYYWLAIGVCDARQVGSELRIRINRLCRETGIEIPFPQRDIRLHASDPLPVTIHQDG